MVWVKEAILFLNNNTMKDKVNESEVYQQLLHIN